MQAYTGAAQQNGKSYLPVMSKGKLTVIEKGADAADYLIYKQVGIVENAEWISAYGVLQDVYNKQSGVDATTAAKAMLKGIERTSTISVLGNTDCTTGRAVFVKEPFTGLTGLFYINTDQHTWQSGQYTMQITVDLQNVMASKTLKLLVDKAKSSKKKKSGSANLLKVLEEGGYKQ